MGRRRKDGNPLGLELRVEWHHGQFRYLHRDGTKEGLGTDIGQANAKARIYNDPDRRYGTLGYFIDYFIAEAEAGRLHKPRKPRTIADNKVEADWLKTAFNKTMPLELVKKPSLIADYRDAREARTRANRELSLLSSVYAWLIEKGLVPGLLVNPVKLIARNTETPKDFYVEDDNYLPVYRRAAMPVRMAMELAYRTLQRPADILGLGPSPVHAKTVAGVSKRVLRVKQEKTGRTVDIEVTPELQVALDMLAAEKGGKVVRLATALVHGRDGSGYTEDGMGAMLRRYCVKEEVKTFGLMDVRAKGATDMYLRGVPLETIQALMGHASVKTTEIYIKRMMQTVSTVQPNAVAVGE